MTARKYNRLGEVEASRKASAPPGVAKQSRKTEGGYVAEKPFVFGRGVFSRKGKKRVRSTGERQYL